MYPGATVLISRKLKNKNKKLSVKSPSSSKATVENQYKLWHHITREMTQRWRFIHVENY